MSLLRAAYNHLHDYRAAWALIVLSFTFFSSQHSEFAQKALKFRYLLHAVTGFGLVLSMTYALAAVLYLIYPNYLDHGEASVAAISWLGFHGAPIYPNWRSGDIYGLPYGPLLFVANGATLLLFPTIFGSKLAGWSAIIIASFLIYVILRVRATDRNMPFLLWMNAIVLFSFFHGPSYAFWNRPEPFLILLSTLTIVAAQTLPGSAAAIAIGILSGLAADFKLPQALCAVPAALAVGGAANSWKNRRSLAMLFLLGATIVSLPFLLNFNGQAAINGYISILLMVSGRGLSLNILKDNVLFALLLMAPIFLVCRIRSPIYLEAFDSWLVLGLAVSLTMVTIITAVPGAGPYHLMPFIPISIYALLSVLEAPTSQQTISVTRRETATLILISFLVCYAPGEIAWTKNFVREFSQLDTEYKKINELKAFSQQHPQAEVGPSDFNHLRDTFYRAITVFQGGPLHIDFTTTWTDLAYAGVPETRIIDFLQRCEISTWLFPLGAPFTIKNYYTKGPLLSEEFRRVFFANYKLVQEGKFYQVWQCR